MTDNDDIDLPEDEDLDVEADEDLPDGEGLDDELEEFDDVAPDGEVEEQDEDEDEDEDLDEARPRARATDDDDDDDDETNPDDVEADLEEILRDRMAASDDDDDDDDDDQTDGVKPAEVSKQRDDEFVCGICFMVVSRAQLSVPCPMGDGVELHQPLER